MKPIHNWRLQFGLRTLLIVPVLVGGVWWWHSWPERTAKKFHRYLVDGNVEAAQRMMQHPIPNGLKLLWTVTDKAIGKSTYVPPTIHSRTLGDWFCSRGEFNLDVDLRASRYYFGRFIASRGTVKSKDQIEPETFITYQTQYLSSEVVFDKIKAEFQPDFHARITTDQKDRVFVLAPKKTQEEIKALLRKIDQPPSPGPMVPQ